MLRIHLAFFVVAFSCMLSHAQVIAPPTGIKIEEDSMRKGADVIWKLDEAVLDILSPSRYTFKQHQIVTILNKQGASRLHHVFGFDKFYKVEDVEIRVLNAFGQEVKKYRKKDFEVQSAFDGISLVTDDKVMRLFTPAPGFPCTLDIRVEFNVTSYLELPNWSISTHKESTELFRYIVKVPSDLDIRYRSKNLDLKPSVQTNNNQKVYVWEMKNIPARPTESDNYENLHRSPQIEVAPNTFEYDGYRGQFKTWKDFGEWCYALYEEKGTPFTPERIAEIKALAETQPDLKGKVASLYDYMKRNMRYVSIQLGIGGFKPFPVRFVDEKKYGDCKALTNYMRNMLAVVNIKSYPALINAGYNKSPADPEFPSSPFNHVILCVPDGKDSIWLECTSNYNATGFLGNFTENKNALLLTEKGGILVPTPRSDYAVNKLNVKTEIFVNPNGGAKISSSIFSSGDVLGFYNALRQLSADRQKELLMKYSNYKLPDQFETVPVRDSSSGYVSEFKFEYEKLFDFNAGNKYFFQQRPNKFVDEDIVIDETRETEYLFEYPYDSYDTTTYHLPPNFTVDNLPPVLELRNQFADYRNEIVYDTTSNRLSIYTKLALRKNIIQPNEYNEIATFFQSVNRNQNQKIILRKD